MAPKKIILVFKTHFDIGFTKLSSEILEYYATEMLDRVVETCDATKDMGPQKYVWTMPAWPLCRMLDRADDTRRAQIDLLVKRGQLRWHALPFTSHYDVSGLDEAIAGLSSTKALSERYGLPIPRAAKMTDVPGFGLMLPEMLASAGIRFLHLGSNEFAAPPQVPTLFWWEAPSGKRVLTMYNNSYGSSVIPPETWPFDTWLALMNTVDNSGPQTADVIREAIDQVHERYPDAEVVCGTLDDFLTELEKQDLNNLPVVTKDLADTWIHGAGSYPKEISMLRRLRGRLLHAQEALSARVMEKSIDGISLEAALRDIALCKYAMGFFWEHTWGLDVKIGLGAIGDYTKFGGMREEARFKRMEASWEEQRARARLAGTCCERLETLLGIHSLETPAVPKGVNCSGEQTLVTDRWKLSFSADTGVIHSLADLRSGKTVLREKDGCGVFSCRYDRYGIEDLTEYLRIYAHRFTDWGIFDNGRINYPECEHFTGMPSLVSCTVEADTLRMCYKGCGCFGDAAGIELTVRLLPEQVRVTLRLEDKAASPYIESGSFCAPLAFEAPEYYINKNGTVIRPETDIVRNANHAFYALENFAAAKENDALVSIVTHDAPLLSIGENGVHAFRPEYEAHSPELRFNLFNNMWGTNFPQWIEGDFEYTFDLFSDSAEELGTLYRRAAACTETLMTKAEAGLPAAFDPRLRVISLLPDGEDLLLTVHNCANETVDRAFESTVLCCEETDLFGRILSEAKETFAVKPYEIKSCRLIRK